MGAETLSSIAVQLGGAYDNMFATALDLARRGDRGVESVEFLFASAQRLDRNGYSDRPVRAAQIPDAANAMFVDVESGDDDANVIATTVRRRYC